MSAGATDATPHASVRAANQHDGPPNHPDVIITGAANVVIDWNSDADFELLA